MLTPPRNIAGVASHLQRWLALLPKLQQRQPRAIYSFRVKEDGNGNYDMTAADVSWSPSAYHADKSGDYDLKIKNWNQFPFTQSVPPH